MSDTKFTREDWLGLFEDCLLHDELRKMERRLLREAYGVEGRSCAFAIVKADQAKAAAVAADQNLLLRIDDLSRQVHFLGEQVQGVVEAPQAIKDMVNRCIARVDVAFESAGFAWQQQFSRDGRPIPGEGRWISRGMNPDEFSKWQEERKRREQIGDVV